jgi:hypothetical protein
MLNMTQARETANDLFELLLQEGNQQAQREYAENEASEDEISQRVRGPLIV